MYSLDTYTIWTCMVCMCCPLGGEKSDGRVTGNCELYDPDTDSWSKAGMLPQPRANPVCAAHRKELYCAGGYYGNTSHKNLW